MGRSEEQSKVSKELKEEFTPPPKKTPVKRQSIRRPVQIKEDPYEGINK